MNGADPAGEWLACYRVNCGGFKVGGRLSGMSTELSLQLLGRQDCKVCITILGGHCQPPAVVSCCMLLGVLASKLAGPLQKVVAG